MSNHTEASMSKSRSSHSGFWLVVIGAALWGVDPLFRVLLLDTFTSSQIVLLEHIIIMAIALPMLWRNRQELQGLKLRHIGALLFISWGGSALATILFTQGLAGGNLNAVLLLQKLQPIFAIILARFILREQLPKHFGFWFVLALFGTYLLTFGWSLPFAEVNEFIQISSLLSIGAAVLWGGSTVMGSYMLKTMKYETVTSLRFVLALPLLLGLTIWEGDAWSLPASTGQSDLVILNLVLQALLPGLLSLLFYYKGLSTTKASYATLAELSFPMVGVIVNWVAFQQIATLTQIMGFVFIWFTLFMISRQKEDVLAA